MSRLQQIKNYFKYFWLVVLCVGVNLDFTAKKVLKLNCCRREGNFSSTTKAKLDPSMAWR